MQSRLTKTRSSLEQYVREINAIPLLTREEEQELAVAVQAGCPVAREHLIRANLRLVVSFAKRFMGRGVEIDEIIAAGNLGLIRGVEGFDPAKGCRFSTYGGLWVLQSMRKVVDELAPTIRVPTYMVQLLAQWRRATAELTETLGREPTREELARRVAVPLKTVPRIEAALLAYRLEPGRTDEDEESAKPELTDSTPTPDELLASSDSARRLRDALGQLDSPEREVLEMCFGLVDGVEHSLKKTAANLGITTAEAKAARQRAMDVIGVCMEYA